jgi:hypothetical protein
MIGCRFAAPEVGTLRMFSLVEAEDALSSPILQIIIKALRPKLSDDECQRTIALFFTSFSQLLKHYQKKPRWVSSRRLKTGRHPRMFIIGESMLVLLWQDLLQL